MVSPVNSNSQNTALVNGQESSENGRVAKTQEMATQTEPMKLPDECYDPVSMEVLERPYVTPCGHTFDRSTILKTHKLTNELFFDCPLCKYTVNIKNMYEEITLESLINRLRNAS